MVGYLAPDQETRVRFPPCPFSKVNILIILRKNMEVFLDSSFIISCIRERIDFLTQLEEQGFKVLVPLEVLQEMKDLRNKNKTSHEDRVAIDVAMEMIENRKVKKTRLTGGSVDDGLIKKGKEGYYIATLDSGIKHEVPKKVVLFRAQGKVGVE